MNKIDLKIKKLEEGNKNFKGCNKVIYTSATTSKSCDYKEFTCENCWNKVINMTYSLEAYKQAKEWMDEDPLNMDAFKNGVEFGREETLKKVDEIIDKFGNEWEVAEEGNISGEFEYKQFKETSLFKWLKKDIHSQTDGRGFGTVQSVMGGERSSSDKKETDVDTKSQLAENKLNSEWDVARAGLTAESTQNKTTSRPSLKNKEKKK